MDKKKIELRILDIYCRPTKTEAFTLLLGETEGERRLPIIIGSHEAQAIIIELRNIAPERPLTHHLFASVLEVLGVQLLRVVIYKIHNGVFYSYLYLKIQETIIRVDARTSDAVILSIRMKAPIYTYNEILEAEIKGESSANPLHTQEGTDVDELLESDTVEILQTALQRAIKEENYELAARLRDQINLRHTHL